ncbi:MAG: hypothetical protein WD042_00485 [Phycisphaeraceae bacterium]
MADKANNNWLADIISAMRALGGGALLRDIYRWVQRHRSDLPTEHESVVRATIYAHSTDARAYVQGNPDVFKNVSRGEWGLRFPDDDIPTHRMSETDWFVHLLDKMTPEEVKSYSGRGEALIEDIRRRVREAQTRYRTDA